MYEAAVLATVILMIAAAADYVRRAWIRQTTPTPATWILLVVTMTLSFWMYWEKNRSWTANIGVPAALVSVTIVLIGVTLVNKRDGTLTIVFDPVQKWCLIAGGAIFVLWTVTHQAFVAYTLVQSLALIAYSATAIKLWNARQSREPVLFWYTILVGSLCAIYPAWVKHDPYAWVYLARAVPSTSFMIFLIVRIKRRMRRSNPS